MIFDRISLVKSYASLKVVELNDGAVKDILFNKTAYYGTKTQDEREKQQRTCVCCQVRW